MRLEEDDFNFVLENGKPIFVTFEKPPAIYEVRDLNNASCIIIKANVSADIITMKSRTKENNVSRSHEK